MSPRADAARNRAKVIEAAEEVFAAQGVSASTEDVAKRAGVGIGTVFRHFPTKEHLLRAVLDAQLAALAAEADRAVGSEDPGAALFAYLRRVVAQSRTKASYSDAIAAAGIDAGDAVESSREQVRRSLGALLARAQDAGAVRADVSVAQVFAVLVGATRAAAHSDWDPVVTDIVLDGLRAGKP